MDHFQYLPLPISLSLSFLPHDSLRKNPNPVDANRPRLCLISFQTPREVANITELYKAYLHTDREWGCVRCFYYYEPSRASCLWKAWGLLDWIEKIKDEAPGGKGG